MSLQNSCETSEQTCTSHLPSGLDFVRVDANDMFVRSVTTVYNEDSWMTPERIHVDGKVRYVVPHVSEIEIRKSPNLILKEKGAVSRIDLIDFPILRGNERYKLKCNGRIVASSSVGQDGNYFDFTSPCSTEMNVFMEWLEPYYERHGYNRPLPVQTLLFDAIDQVEIIKPKSVTWPDRCLVRMTMHYKHMDGTFQRTIDLTPTHVVHTYLSRVTKYLAMELPKDTWLKITVDPYREIVHLATDYDAPDKQTLIINLRDGGSVFKGRENEFITDQDTLNFSRIDCLKVESNRLDQIKMWQGHYIIQEVNENHTLGPSFC